MIGSAERGARGRHALLARLTWAAAGVVALALGCGDLVVVAALDAGGGSDADSDGDIDLDADSDGDSDTDGDTDTGSATECSWHTADLGPLYAVWGLSADAVFAVGGETSLYGNSIAERFDGAGWSSLPDPGIGPVGLRGVWGSAANELFVVAEAFAALRYDGAGWDVMTVYTDSLNSVWATGGSGAFAVGGLFGAAAAEFDGSQWVQVAEMPGGPLADVWGSSVSDVYAVGAGTFGVSPVVRYNGSAWSVVDLGTFDLLDLESVWGSGPADVYAVGSHLFGGPAALRYDGAGWESVELGTLPGDAELHGVSGRSAAEVYIVGAAGAAGIMLRGGGGSWTEVDGPFDFPLEDVWIAATGEVFAVGQGGVVYCTY